MFLRTAKTVGKDEGKHGLLYKPESFLNERKVDLVFSKTLMSLSQVKGCCEKDITVAYIWM